MTPDFQSLPYQLPEKTKRFFVMRDPNRRGIDGQPSRICEVYYQPEPGVAPREFAHVWTISGWGLIKEGKWTFNRSTVCIVNEWWPAIYEHNTLQDLLNHLEETFIEGVPANQPD